MDVFDARLLFLCFCKMKTAYEMRISDWSSDVCSSDLSLCIVALVRPNSTTGHKACRKRASDVPPVVDISGITSVSAWIASATSADRSPGGVRKASPEDRKSGV